MATTWRDAIVPTKNGVRLDVDVTPNAKGAAFPAGYDPWRNRIGGRVQSPATEGRANNELVQLVATRLDVSARDIRVVSGATSPQKRLEVIGLSQAQVTERLAGGFE